VESLLLVCVLASRVFGDEQANRAIPSSNTAVSVRSLWIADDPHDENYIHCAVLQRGEVLPWAFSARGRAMVFSWSPDARYLLVGVVKGGKDMSLYYLDTATKQPKERNLDLEAVEVRVRAALPERNQISARRSRLAPSIKSTSSKSSGLLPINVGCATSRSSTAKPERQYSTLTLETIPPPWKWKQSNQGAQNDMRCRLLELLRPF
jgi:hypothetical protein